MLVLLHPYKFTEFHFLQYEFDLFEKKLCTDFEIHDLSQIINPDWNDVFKLKRHKKAKRFYSINEWEMHIKKLAKRYQNLVVFNNLDLNSFKSILIHQKLNKFCKTIIKLDDPGQPNEWFEIKKKFSINDYYKKIIKEFKNPNHFLFFIKTKFLEFLCKFIIFERIYSLYHGKEINYASNLKCKKELFINIHSPDYSRLISYTFKKKKLKKPIVTFLDAPGPYFKNDFDLFNLKISYDKTRWYSDLNRFLLKIKKKYSCDILIIPHPKVKRLKNPYYSKQFKVNHDLDAVHKFIPLSKFVISISPSTALGLACACNKPILLLYNNQIKALNPTLFNSIKFISKKYKTNLFNLSKDNEIFIKSTSKSFNKKILFKYITSKKISKIKNYDIFNNILLNKYR